MVKRGFLIFQISRHTPIVGIPALLKAVQKLQLSESSLTSVHADVCRLCLAAKCFAPAVNILNVDVTDISAEAAEEPKYILLYFYYGGMIFTALKVLKVNSTLSITMTDKIQLIFYFALT